MCRYLIDRDIWYGIYFLYIIKRQSKSLHEIKKGAVEGNDTPNKNIEFDKKKTLKKWFGSVSLFNGISTLFRLFNAKAILLEEQ